MPLLVPAYEVRGPRLSAPEHLAQPENDFLESESRRSALAIHEKAVIRAHEARVRLEVILDAGIPTRPIKGDPDAGERLKVAQAIDAFARSQCWLREAAQAVCDICEFTDNGKSAGVVWETPLATEGRT